MWASQAVLWKEDGVSRAQELVQKAAVSASSSEYLAAVRWPVLAVSLLGLTLETNAHVCEGVSRLGWKTLSEYGWHHHKGWGSWSE